MLSLHSFEPDCALVSRVLPSPNFEPRREGMAPNIILLHYTGMASGEAAMQWLAAPESRVSAHYVADEEGAITQLVPEAMRAWHAGASHWLGESDINSASIGIEIHNSGHDHGYPDFPDAQVESVITLCRDIMNRRSILPQRVLAHSDVAPGRKIDPGEKFPWAKLSRAGVGHWVEPAPYQCGETLGLGDCNATVLRLQRQLRAYGYWIEETGVYDERTGIAIKAFQRHFRPALIDGRADRSTIETLDALLAALPLA